MSDGSLLFLLPVNWAKREFTLTWNEAKEIDWDTRNQKSYLRGGVSTTYYSQRTTDGAAKWE